MSTLQDHKVVTIMKFSGNIRSWYIKLETTVKSKMATLQDPEVKCKHGLTIWTKPDSVPAPYFNPIWPFLISN